MPDVTLSEALREAYASAPASTPLIHTLSITYDGLEVDGVPGEIYVYQGFSGDTETAEGVPLKSFRLEAGARYRGGEVVTFIAFPFDVQLPNVAAQSVVKGRLVIDGVGREISDHLREAATLGVPIEITYRAYLGGLELEGPQNDPPISFSLQNARATSDSVSGEIAVTNLALKRFPRELYRTTRFPGLRA